MILFSLLSLSLVFASYTEVGKITSETNSVMCPQACGFAKLVVISTCLLYFIYALCNWVTGQIQKLFGCTLMSVKVLVEVVTALLLNASNVGLSVVLLFELLESCHS